MNIVLNDEEFIKGLEENSLPPNSFTHAAHLRLAWINNNSMTLEKAIETTQTQISNYVKRVGAEDKYNKTLTFAAVVIIREFMENSRLKSFDDFLKEFPDLASNFKEQVLNHYSVSLLESESAKKEVLQPDIKPLVIIPDMWSEE